MNNRDLNNFHTPEFQADLDETKIQEMVDSFRTCRNHFISQMLLTIANVQIAGEEINYIMDGQHRMEMIKILYEKYGENLEVFLAIHILNDEIMLRHLFDNLNKDSTKHATYVKLPIFKKQSIDHFRKAISSQYIGCYEKTKKQNSHIKTINELIEDLEQHNFFSNYFHLTTPELVAMLNNRHIEYINYIGYLENVYNNASQYYSDEQTMIKDHKNVMFFKNNNFVEYVCNSEDMQHFYNKNVRKGISADLRKKVWKNQFGNKTSGTCPIIGCNHLLSSIDKRGFQCGHIISVKNGGKEELSNLRPICADCNSKMGSTNWDDFVIEQEQKLLENEKNLFDDMFNEQVSKKIKEDLEEEHDNTINCNMCSKSITKDKSKIIKFNGLNQIVCQKCCIKSKNMDLKLIKN
jgi:hypothetical protein